MVAAVELWLRRLTRETCSRAPSLILTNELPRLDDSSGALASRFIMVTLTRSFYGSVNPTLTDELLTEATGILNWALDGSDRLRERGHFVQPESSREAVRRARGSRFAGRGVHP